MNDVEDCSLCRKLLQATIPLQQAISQAIGRGTVPETLAKKYFAAGMAMPTFAACFTTKRDDALMWQLHTRGGGVAIGFDRNLQVAVKTQEDPCFDVSSEKCIYDRYSLYSDEVGRICKELAGIPNFNCTIRYEDIKDHFGLIRQIRDLAAQLVFVKKASFSWEEEIRFAFVLRNGCNLGNRLRIINGNPFVTMMLPNNQKIGRFVKEILISPFGNVAKTRAIAFMVGETINLPAKKIQDGTLDFLHLPCALSSSDTRNLVHLEESPWKEQP